MGSEMCIRDRFYAGHGVQTDRGSYLLPTDIEGETTSQIEKISYSVNGCLLYTSDAADERSSVDLGGRRIIKKKKKAKHI